MAAYGDTVIRENTIRYQECKYKKITIVTSRNPIPDFKNLYFN